MQSILSDQLYLLFILALCMVGWGRTFLHSILYLKELMGVISNEVLMLFLLKFAKIRENYPRDKQIKVIFNLWLTKTFSEKCKSLETYELDLKAYVYERYDVHPLASNEIK